MLEKEKTISKYLQEHKIISLVGMSKNAGKTTVLNQLLSECTSKVAITSIGLDGEKIDNVNKMPKPRIRVKKGSLIATAEKCLIESEILYAVHERTRINTALGNIILIEALSDGFVLVAGPSTKTKMKSLLNILKKYNTDYIFLDGALFRKSFSVKELVDAMILVTGAAYSKDMNRTIKDTKILLDQLSLKICNDPYNFGLVDKKNSGFMIQKGFEKDTIFNMIDKNKIDVKYLKLKGAITDKIAKRIIESREYFKKSTIEIDDTISFLCDADLYEKLNKIDIYFCVENTIPVLFLAINPYSPDGYEYDKETFKNEMQKRTKLKCINVLTDLE